MSLFWNLGTLLRLLRHCTGMYFVFFRCVTCIYEVWPERFDLVGKEERERETGMFLEGIRKKEFTSMIALYYIHVLNVQYELGI